MGMVLLNFYHQSKFPPYIFRTISMKLQNGTTNIYKQQAESRNFQKCFQKKWL